MVIDPVTNGIIAEFIADADLGSSDTSLVVQSTTTTNDIEAGVIIQPKKDVVPNKLTSLDTRLTTAEGNVTTNDTDIATLQARILFTAVLKVADYTLAIGDEFKLIQCNSASAIVITVPLHVDDNFELGTIIKVLKYGLGAVSVVGDGAVSIISENGYNIISGQYGVVTLNKIAPDEWVLYGDLSS